MPNPDRVKLTSNVKRAIRERIIARDGPHCFFKMQGVASDGSHAGRLELHHVNEDCNDWSDDKNLRLLCKECHGVFASGRGESRRGTRTRQALKGLCDNHHNKGEYEREREREGRSVRARVEVDSSVRTKVEAGSRELILKEHYLPRFIKYLFGVIGRCGSISASDAEDEGMIETGASQQTLRRYLQALTSNHRNAPFRYDIQGNVNVIVLRLDDDTYENWKDRQDGAGK